MNQDKIVAQLINHEELRLKMYKDSTGVLTIGVGHNLDQPISHDAVMQILADDITIATSDVEKHFPWWSVLDDVRQRVLVDMCFNMGIVRLSGFTHMLSAAHDGDYELAAQEMENSIWYTQVGRRGSRLAYMMRSGNDPA